MKKTGGGEDIAEGCPQHNIPKTIDLLSSEAFKWQSSQKNEKRRTEILAENVTKNYENLAEKNKNKVAK